MTLSIYPTVLDSQGQEVLLRSREVVLDLDVYFSQTVNIPSRNQRRFKIATGSSLIEYLQNLHVEAAKRLLEAEQLPVDEISFVMGYEDASFFRRLFKRLTGLTPSQYRRMFKPVLSEVGIVA